MFIEDMFIEDIRHILYLDNLDHFELILVTQLSFLKKTDLGSLLLKNTHQKQSFLC